MYRFAEQFLHSWYWKNNKKPLIIRGARQVGKSTLVRNFAEKHHLVLYEINLERHLWLDKIFAGFNPQIILQEISSVIKKSIQPQNSLLFLDEIQATPSAIQALRYFYEDIPELSVVCAGSLLEFTLAKHNFSMPVGRIEYLFLGPMSFREFLIAKKEDYLTDLIKNHKITDTFSQSAHEQLLRLQRNYMFIGGMPEAILSSIRINDVEEISRVHSSIIETYQDDFSKYAKDSDLIRLGMIFNRIPRMVGEKIKYSNISRDEQARELKKSINLLEKALILKKIYHSNCSGVPLNAEIDFNVYKTIFLDIGLMNKICGLDQSEILRYDDFSIVNKRALAEQFIGQHLLLRYKYEKPYLNYWLREKKTANAEIDFVINNGTAIIPIEVKSGKSGTLKSILQFVYQKKLNFAVRFDVNIPSIQNVSHSIRTNDGSKQVDYVLLSLPLYLIEELFRIFNSILSSN